MKYQIEVQYPSGNTYMINDTYDHWWEAEEVIERLKANYNWLEEDVNDNEYYIVEVEE